MALLSIPMSPLFLAQSGALKTAGLALGPPANVTASSSAKKEAAQRSGFKLEGGEFV